MALLSNNLCVSISALVFGYCFYLINSTPEKSGLHGHENVRQEIEFLFNIIKLSSAIPTGRVVIFITRKSSIRSSKDGIHEGLDCRIG